MNLDFHYYATYCAACLAGYTPEEAADISYAAAMVDNCTATYLQSVNGPEYAATTQTNAELATFSMNALNRQLITRIWSSFHFLPKDLKAELPGKPKGYMNKYRLIAGPNGELVKKTVEQAQQNGHFAAIGIAMHVLADTWAHANFAGTPSLVINNTNFHFYEVLEEDGKTVDKQMKFIHSLGAPDDLEQSTYVNTLYQPTEYSIMSLGHGRAGHLPDYSFVKYKYLPAWGQYEEILKDNPSDYWCAFRQMVYALKWLRNPENGFELNTYDETAVEPYREKINAIINKRQPSSDEDWKALGKEISGVELVEFDKNKYNEAYMNAPRREQDTTYLGEFFNAAMDQKNMVTESICDTGNMIAGLNIKINGKNFETLDDLIAVFGMLKGGKMR